MASFQLLVRRNKENILNFTPVRFHLMAKTSSTKEFNFTLRIFLNFFLYLRLFISVMCNYLCRIYFHPTSSKFLGNFVLQYHAHMLC